MKFVVFVSFVSLKKKRGFKLQRREVNPGFLRFDFGKENLLSEGVDGHTIYVVFAGLIPPGAYLGIWPGFGKFRAGPGCKNVVSGVLGQCFENLFFKAPRGSLYDECLMRIQKPKPEGKMRVSETPAVVCCL